MIWLYLFLKVMRFEFNKNWFGFDFEQLLLRGFLLTTWSIFLNLFIYLFASLFISKIRKQKNLNLNLSYVYAYVFSGYNFIYFSMVYFWVRCAIIFMILANSKYNMVNIWKLCRRWEWLQSYALQGGFTFFCSGLCHFST